METPRSVSSPSKRALANLQSGAYIDLENEASKLPAYHPTQCPDGLIDLSGAVNTLMVDFMKERTDEFARGYDLEKALRYGNVIGPPELSDVVARFVNKHFQPAHAVSADHILTTNGVSSLIDLMAFNFCDPGEGIMLLTPAYMMFPHDLCARTGVQLVTVPTECILDQFSAPCAPDVIAHLETAFGTAQRYGISCRAIFVCNPANPSGRAYSKTTLIAIARFCGQRGMHLLADEIYAMSCFQPTNEDLEGRGALGIDMFTSVLSIPDDPAHGVFKENIHAMYGASKDFGAGGLRLGFLVTRNEMLWKTCRRLALFTWLTTFSTAFFTHFLANEEVVDDYQRTYRGKLRKSYVHASGLLRRHGIPYQPANCGVFVFINLSKWLPHFDGRDSGESQELKLCRYLMHQGVFISMGEMSLSRDPGYFRFVYTADEDIVALAVARLGKAVAKLEKTPTFAVRITRPPSSILSNDKTLVETLTEMKTHKSRDVAGQKMTSKFRSVLETLFCRGDKRDL